MTEHHVAKPLAEGYRKRIDDDLDYLPGDIRILIWNKDRPRNKIKAGDEAGYINYTRSGPRRKIRITVDGKSKLFLRSHIVYYKTYGEWPTQTLDHIDGDTLNDHIENLQLCSHAENLRKQRMHKDNSSGYKGVTWHKRDRKWRAQIRVDSKVKHLGYFDDKHDAARAYNEAARKYFGKFASLNTLPEQQEVQDG